ncbi:hypothetical protein C8J57DRAFT_1459112 [Mycena rebaudengoi]|nr:hypothetical protein C8J57DRAFT_1459112 [Mycena rebaudengoi]
MHNICYTIVGAPEFEKLGSRLASRSYIGLQLATLAVSNGARVSLRTPLYGSDQKESKTTVLELKLSIPGRWIDHSDKEYLEVSRRKTLWLQMKGNGKEHICATDLFLRVGAAAAAAPSCSLFLSKCSLCQSLPSSQNVNGLLPWAVAVEQHEDRTVNSPWKGYRQKNQGDWNILAPRTEYQAPDDVNQLGKKPEDECDAACQKTGRDLDRMTLPRAQDAGTPTQELGVFRLAFRVGMAFPAFNVVPQNFRRAAFQNYCSSHPKSINDARQVFFGGNRRAQLPYINMSLHTDLHYTIATLPQNRCIDVLDDGAVQRERPQQVRTSIERRGKDLVYRALG